MTMRRILVAVFFLGSLLTMGGCASTGGAANHTAQKPPEDRDPQLLFERGKAYADMGDLVRAEQYFGAALTAHADERRVLPELLRVCVTSRHYRLASEYAQIALSRRPRDAHLRFVVGALYVSIGEIGRAREHLEQAARDMPNDAEVQFAVGTFFRDELTDQIGADPYFREYLRLAPRGNHADEARVSLMQKVEIPAPEAAQ